MAEPVPRNPGPPRIRSRPERVRSSTRLPGADAAGGGGDASWQRGVTVLWVLFGLIAAAEALLLTVYLSAGGLQWPHVSDVFRLTVFCGVFLALWLGWYWTRWVLAVVAFFAGARTLVLVLVTSNRGAGSEYLTSAELFGSTVYTGILVLVGTLYLALAAYLIFSADVLAFTEHRRQEGRAWVVFPVALLLGIYWATMLGGDFALRRWLAGTRASMEQLARTDVRRIAAGWDPASLATVLDSQALQAWPPEGREGFMQTVRPLGTYLVSSDVSAQTAFDHDPATMAMQVRGEYQEVVRCTNGHARFVFRMTRPLMGSWRVNYVTVGEVEFYTSPPSPSPGR